MWMWYSIRLYYQWHCLCLETKTRHVQWKIGFRFRLLIICNLSDLFHCMAILMETKANGQIANLLISFDQQRLAVQSEAKVCYWQFSVTRLVINQNFLPANSPVTPWFPWIPFDLLPRTRYRVVHCCQSMMMRSKVPSKLYWTLFLKKYKKCPVEVAMGTNNSFTKKKLFNLLYNEYDLYFNIFHFQGRIQ